VTCLSRGEPGYRFRVGLRRSNRTARRLEETQLVILTRWRALHNAIGANHGPLAPFREPWRGILVRGGLGGSEARSITPCWVMASAIR
jgi:hypothetical protein